MRNLTCRGIWFCVVALLFAGCKERLNTRYGEMSGMGASSVNGTSVFADLLRQSGHKVTATSRLSPRIQRRAEVIVWFPDTFDLPNNETRKWLEAWLAEPGRTLIYVGRDYDAAATYWSTILPTLDPKSHEANEMRIDLATAQADLATRRQRAQTAQAARTQKFDDYEDWFVYDFANKFKTIDKFDGFEYWTDTFDPAKAQIQLASGIEPEFEVDVLLETATGKPLVSVLPWNEGEIIFVANGSFLLNLATVNHEHRKLAGTLIDELGDEPRQIFFLESGERGPWVSEQDQDQRSGLEILTIPPFHMILLHVSIVGVIFAFARWPVFGVASTLVDKQPGDFGRHIVALGRLLEANGDRTYAEQRVQQFLQLPRGESRARRSRRG